MKNWFDGRDKLLKIILLIPIWGWIVAGLYRISIYLKTKNMSTLIAGILTIIPIIGIIVCVIDIITVYSENRIVFFAK